MLALFLPVYCLSVFAVGYAIFSPFKLIVAKTPDAGARFQLVDMFSACLPIPTGLTVLNTIFPDIDWNVSAAVSTIFVLLVINGLTWVYGVRLLRRMTRKSSHKRIAMLGFMMPIGTVVPAIALPVLLNVENIQQFAIRLLVLAAIIVLLRYTGCWIQNDAFPHSHQTPNAG